MESIIYIGGAFVFGISYAFLKPLLDAPWLIAIAIVYFCFLRPVGYAAKRYALRRALGRASNTKQA
jgi:hypothetical protein